MSFRNEYLKILVEFGYNLLDKTLYGFEFNFNNYYVVVKGFMPLDTAIEMNKSEFNRRNIRVAGYAGGVDDPTVWANWYNKSGKILMASDEKAGMEELAEKFNFGKIENYRYVEDPSKVGFGYITEYHINSAAGLVTFCKVLEILNSQHRTIKILLPHMEY